VSSPGASIVDDPPPRGAARARRLWRLWRNERADPEPFYAMLADEAIRALEARHGEMHGLLVVDIGSGPGYYADVFEAHGARVVALDVEHDRAETVRGAVLGDAAALPVASGSADGVFCSNMLEHVPDPGAVIDEMTRVLRPGGWGYLSFTNWYSPFGGHDISPYHYLGTRLGPRLYERRHGPPAKNRFGEMLFPLHIGPTLRRLRGDPRARVDRVEPRYWPWAGFIARVPLVREVLCWNCAVYLTRTDEPDVNG
jgi:SAM-dependent methyltransferase